MSNRDKSKTKFLHVIKKKFKVRNLINTVKKYYVFGSHNKTKM